MWLGRQAPEPLQVSGESHWPDEGSPHAVPTDLNPLSWQAPELSQVSWLMQSVPASPQLVPAATWLGSQVPLPVQVGSGARRAGEGWRPLFRGAMWLAGQAPEPLQVSGESHCPDEESPQAVPEALKPLSWQAPEPSQVSWLMQSAPASPQLVPAATWLGSQVPLPLHV